MTYQGRVNHGVVVLENDIELPEGTVVKIETVDPQTPETADDRLYRLGELAVPTGITDLALNIDHYLYGYQKVNDAER